MVPSLTPYDLQNGVPCPNIREWPYLCNDDPIHFMFGSRVGFSWTAKLMALFSIQTKYKSKILDNFEWPYLHNVSYDLLI